MLGCAQTGTGKTAAFALPILQRVRGRSGRQPRLLALVLTPTRELAAQIGESFSRYGKHLDLYHTVIFGGVGQGPQEKELDLGVDVLVATPGRLLDLMGQGMVRLDDVEIFVLDEADRMLDMGFLSDVRRVVAAPPVERQTFFFSATMPCEIEALARRLLRNPERIAVTPVSSVAPRVEQRVHFVERAYKTKLLLQVLEEPGVERALVFSRTKQGANKVAQQLVRAGVRSAAIHGNKSQGARTRALEGFRSSDVRVLVATDLAARGLDVAGITHVVNFDLPNVPETYVHRIGRTGRAEASGVAISFCDSEERAYLADVEKLIRQRIERVEEHSFAGLAGPEPALSPSRGPVEPRGAPRGRAPSRATRGSRGSSRRAATSR